MRAPTPRPPAGDSQPVSIGHNTNLQDGVSVGSLRSDGHGTKIGSFVTVGHNAVLQSCTVLDQSLIGMNAVVQDGATVRCPCCWRGRRQPRTRL
jgi:carbonic anhydrase/acetyltransferase-like protein (isoleucine patch superfamily)